MRARPSRPPPLLPFGRPLTRCGAPGSKFLGKFEIAQLDSEMLRNLTIIDSPGVLSGQKQATRGYDYPSVTKHFADRADRILLLFDCSKLVRPRPPARLPAPLAGWHSPRPPR